MQKFSAAAVLTVFLLSSAAHGRQLRQQEVSTVTCRGGQCSLRSVSTSPEGDASSIQVLDTTGITSTGSYDGTFACYVSTGLPNYDVEKIDNVITPAVVSIVGGGMTCVSSAPIFCDNACCSVDGVEGVAAKSCLDSAVAAAAAPSAPVVVAAGSPAVAPVLNVSTVGVACNADGCTLDGRKLSTDGIVTTGSYDGLFSCFTPPVDAPIADVVINSTNYIMPGTITNLNRAMQCVFNGQIQCDVSCCTLGNKKSCLERPL